MTTLLTPSLDLVYRSTYFSGAKFAWMAENVPEIAAAKEDGSLMIGTVDSWLLYVRLSPLLLL